MIKFDKYHFLQKIDFGLKQKFFVFLKEVVFALFQDTAVLPGDEFTQRIVLLLKHILPVSLQVLVGAVSEYAIKMLLRFHMISHNDALNEYSLMTNQEAIAA